MSGARRPDAPEVTGDAAQAGPAGTPYRLRWTLSGRDGAGATERIETLRAATDPEAIEIARAAAEAADEALLAVALTGRDGRWIWGLERGEILSRRPDDVPRP